MNETPIDSTLPTNGSERAPEDLATTVLVDCDGKEYETVVIRSEDFHSSCSV